VIKLREIMISDFFFNSFFIRTEFTETNLHYLISGNDIRGDLLILESLDDDGNAYLHARLRRKSINKWFLEMPVKRGWESTFIEGTIQELIKLLIDKFPWTLSQI